MRIITNNAPRDVIYGFELSAAERAEFDYIDWDAVEAGDTDPEFVRYQGKLHDLHEFMSTHELSKDADLHDLSDWDGYQADSFFSGLVVRFVDDYERVIVGTYMA